MPWMGTCAGLGTVGGWGAGLMAEYPPILYLGGRGMG